MPFWTSWWGGSRRWQSEKWPCGFSIRCFEGGQPIEPDELVELPSYARVQDGYNRMWKAGRLDIEGGNVDADPIPTATSLRWGVSILATIAPPLAATLEALAADCQYLCGNNHTFYKRATSHVTVRSCEFHRVNVARDDPYIRAYRTVLADVCREHNPFEIAYCGLNANRTGIISQGYPLSEALQALREAIHKRLAKRGVRHGPEAEKVRQTAHTSIAVFGGAVADPAKLYGWIEANRETWCGITCITHLSLVRYDRSAYDVRLVPFATFALSG